MLQWVDRERFDVDQWPRRNVGSWHFCEVRGHPWNVGSRGENGPTAKSARRHMDLLFARQEQGFSTTAIPAGDLFNSRRTAQGLENTAACGSRMSRTS